MSKKNIFYPFCLLAAAWLILFAPALAQPEIVSEAESFLAKKDYSAALQAFEKSFEAGYYTEKSLYQLAELHEKAGNYAMAVFYLRKVNQTFGGKLVEDKIRYLVQLAGGKSLYSSSGWDSFLRMIKRYNLAIWVIFLLLLTAILLFIFRPTLIKDSIARVATPAVIGLFVLASTLLFVRLFLIPDQAVLVVNTPSFDVPGYSARPNATAISPGETVDIVEESDIWVLVEAGPQRGWVPAFTLKRL